MASDAQIRSAFDAADSNKDGRLSIDEVATAVKQLAAATGQSLFRLCDKDRSGTLDFDEFKSFFNLAKAAEKNKSLNNDALQALFKAYDEDGNGKLDKGEVTKALRAWGGDVSASNVDGEWAKWDSNGDGFIDFEEFKKVLAQ